MRRIAGWVILYLLILQHVVNGGKWDNIVPNPSFEEVDLDGWAVGWPRPHPVWRVDDTVAHSGKRSLTIANTDPKLYVFPSLPIPCEPGQSYDISAWVKTKDVKNVLNELGGSLGATICVEWRNDAGKWMGGFYEIYGLLGTQDWVRISAEEVVIPKDAKGVTFTVYMRKGLTGQAWFDDVSVTRHRRPLLSTFLAYPNYRGIFFAPREGRVEATLNLEDHDLTPETAVLKTEVRNANGATIWSKETPAQSGEHIITFPSKNLPDGKSELLITIVRNADNTTLAGASHRLERRAPPAIPGGAWIDERNTLMVDGKPFFPLGWYLHEGVVSEQSYKDLVTLSDSPFNCIMNYGITFPAVEKIRAYMDRAHQLGLKVIFSIKDVYAGTQYCPMGIIGPADEEKLVRTMVENFGTHPALLAWYLNDELPTLYLPRLRARQELMCEIEPNHPTWIVHYYSDVKLLAQYVNTTDVMGVDPYPVPRRPVTYVSEHTDAAVAAARGARPVWVVPQAFAWYVYNKEVRAGKRPPTEKELEEGREPTMDEIRCMSYLALIHGAKGLIYYSYSDLKRSPNYAMRWEGMKAIAAELRTLSDIILQGERLLPAPVNCDNKAVDLGVWRQNGAMYVLATNTSDTSCKATFTIAHSAVTRWERLNKGDQGPLHGSSWTDNLEPFGCRAYAMR